MLKNAKSLNWASEMFYFTNKLNANVQKKPLLSPLIYLKSSLQKWKNLEGSYKFTLKIYMHEQNL